MCKLRNPTVALQNTYYDRYYSAVVGAPTVVGAPYTRECSTDLDPIEWLYGWGYQSDASTKRVTHAT